MNNTNFIEGKLHGTNPIVALGFVIVVSSLMVIITTVIFLNSSAYQTVKQIQSGIKATSESDLNNYDTKSPIQAGDIDEFTENLKQKTAPINNEQDFNNPALDYSNLGIN